MPDDAYWLDTGLPQTYLQANYDILNGRDVRHSVAKIVDGSWSHRSSKVEKSATLVNSVVDRNCYVGANVLLDGVVLLPGAIIEEGCEVRSSIIGPRGRHWQFFRVSAPPAWSARRSTWRQNRNCRVKCASAACS